MLSWVLCRLSRLGCGCDNSSSTCGNHIGGATPTSGASSSTRSTSTAYYTADDAQNDTNRQDDSQDNPSDNHTNNQPPKLINCGKNKLHLLSAPLEAQLHTQEGCGCLTKCNRLVEMYVCVCVCVCVGVCVCTSQTACGHSLDILGVPK